jgi:hypothetical protein
MALQVATGTYVGTGGTSGSRSITGVGFQPKFVLVWSSDTVEIYPAFTFESALTGLGDSFGFWGENSWVFGAPYTTHDRFTSLDADGFTFLIGSSTTASTKALNKSGTNFYYVCLGGDDIFTSSYVGNGADNRNITGVGFESKWIFMMLGAQHQVMKFPSAGLLTDITSFTYNGADITNAIQQIQADGFQVGNANQTNQTGQTCYYMCIKDSASIFQGEYAGNNSDNRDITGVGFQPDFVLLKSAAARNSAFRSADPAGDLTKYYRSVGLFANYVQSLDVDGFQIGNATDINASSTTVRYVAFIDGGAGGGPTSSIKSIDGVLKADIKSFNGVLDASVKSINGISNV